MRKDPRISAEEFKQLIFKAMRLRNSKEHLDLLFRITDVDSNNRIHFYDLQRLQTLAGQKQMSNKDA